MLILASKSKYRAALLTRLGVPFTVQPADVDESALAHEAPLAYVKRIAMAKAAKVAQANPGKVVLAADTPVIVGRRILQTPATVEEAAAMLRLQSGRRVHIVTVVVAVDANGKTRSATVDSWVKFKPLSEGEITTYLANNPWHQSGAISFETVEPWVIKMQGSFSGIIGLPLYETSQLLRQSGIQVNPHGHDDAGC